MKILRPFVFGLLGALLAVGPALADENDRNACFPQKNCVGSGEAMDSLRACRDLIKKTEPSELLGGGSYIDEKGVCTNMDTDGNFVD